MDPSASSRFDTLDGLRGVAVLTVVLYHSRVAGFRGGFLGVDIFFVLSGFLITTLLLRERARTGSVDLKRFYVRRALRLLPALIVLLTVALAFPRVFLQRLEDGHSPRLWLAALSAISYASNWVRAFELHEMGYLEHTWSLGMEEQFYTLWPPLLLLLLSRRIRGPWIVAIIAAGIALSAGLRALLWHGPDSFLRVYYGLDTRMDSLLVGCLLAYLLARNMVPRTPGWAAGIRIGAVLAGGVLAILIHQAGYTSASTYHGGLLLAALAIGVVLLHLVHSPSRAAVIILGFPVLVWVGRISYGVYLWHTPVLTGLQEARLVRLGIPAPMRAVFVVAVTFAVAAISFYVIERPILRANDRRRERGRIASADAVVARI